MFNSAVLIILIDLCKFERLICCRNLVRLTKTRKNNKLREKQINLRNAKYLGPKTRKFSRCSKLSKAVVRMTTNKRLAKRSIVGTRVVAPGSDKLYYSGTIQKVKTQSVGIRDNNCIMLTPDTKYMVRFDIGQEMIGTSEYLGSELIGPGFQSVMNVHLAPRQRVFITFNGRESVAEVLSHDFIKDEVCVRIPGSSFEVSRFFCGFFHSEM